MSNCSKLWAAWIAGGFLGGCTVNVDAPSMDTGNDGGSDFETESTRPVGELGAEAGAVLVVNPVINEGSTVENISIGDDREDITITVSDTTEVQTNATGLVFISDLTPGMVPLVFQSGTVDLEILADAELVDLAISVTVTGVVELFPPIRYFVDGPTVTVRNTDELRAQLSSDNTIVLLEPGTYTGPFEIEANNLILMGSFSSDGELLSTLEGDLTIRGDNVKVRTVDINGELSVEANDFSAVFCEIESATIVADNVLLMRNRFTGGAIRINGENVLLLDNVNVNFDPTPPPPPGEPFAGRPQCFEDLVVTTTALVLVDPVINLSTTFEIDVDLDLSAEAVVSVGDLPSITTDAEGIAVITDVDVESLTIDVEVGQVDVDVVAEGDLVEIIVFRTPVGLLVPLPAIRHPGDHEVITVNEGEDLAAAVSDNDARILLGPGEFEGPLTVTGNNITLAGICSDDGGPASIINGDLIITGNDVRIRGVQVNGAVVIQGNNVSVAFSEFQSVEISGNNTVLFRNTFLEGEITLVTLEIDGLFVANANIP